MHNWSDLSMASHPNEGILGCELAPFPYISGYGMMIRAWRLNALSRCDLHGLFGIRAIKKLELVRACHQPGKSSQHFAHAIGLHESPILDYWREESWCPMKLDGRWHEISHRPRHCLDCQAYGYHCALFQMPFVNQCPWHLKALIDACPCCQRPFSDLLDENTVLGKCNCGRDLFNRRRATVGMWEFPTLAATQALETYLDWCRHERNVRCLIAPDSQGSWWPALNVLSDIPFPDMVRPTSTAKNPSRLWRIEQRSPPKELPPSFWPWVVIGTSPAFDMAQLPTRLFRPLARVTKTVVAALPVGSQTPPYCKAFGLDENLLLMENVIERPHCFLLPFFRKPTREPWLHLSAVEPTTLQMCSRLLAAMDRYISGPTNATNELSAETAKADALDRIAGRWRLHAALCHLLLRGYAKGLTIILRRDVCQGLFPPSLMRVYIPIVEISGAPGILYRIQIGWFEKPDDRPATQRPKLQLHKKRASRSASKIIREFANRAHNPSIFI